MLLKFIFSKRKQFKKIVISGHLYDVHTFSDLLSSVVCELAVSFVEVKLRRICDVGVPGPAPVKKPNGIPKVSPFSIINTLSISNITS